MNIPDAAVKAGELAALGRYLNKATVHLILEAAAPFIAAKALEDAADSIEPLWFVYHGGRLDHNESRRNSLRARAAAVRGEG